MSSESEDLKVLYANRFGSEEVQRGDLWAVLCSDFFQKFVPESSTTLDVAAGHCEFINDIKSARRLAVDLNPDVLVRATHGVKAFVSRSDTMTDIDTSSVDRVFISNFFEHVPRGVIISTLDEVRRVLAPSGKVMVLQPNVRYCARDYWMFFDHITPVDDRALSDASAATGFDIELNIPRFLPYTTKSRFSGRGRG
ncbi:MAG: class I SAM-dependent methyltransferase [Actinomycetota bacterium]|nr:class I SAM-dependent methyltransferase [Actinomycetota bacterium]